MRKVSVYNPSDDSFVTIEISSEIFDRSCLKDMTDFTESSQEDIIILPKEQVDIYSLFRVLGTSENPSFKNLVTDYKAADFLGLTGNKILSLIAKHRDYDPRLLGYFIEKVKPLLYLERYIQTLEYWGTTSFLEKIFLHLGRIQDFSEFDFVEISRNIQDDEFLGFLSDFSHYCSKVCFKNLQRNISPNAHAGQILSFVLDVYFESETEILVVGDEDDYQMFSKYFPSLTISFLGKVERVAEIDIKNLYHKFGQGKMGTIIIVDTADFRLKDGKYHAFWSRSRAYGCGGFWRL